MYAIKGKKKPKFINYDIFNMELKNTIYIISNFLFRIYITIMDFWIFFKLTILYIY